MSDTPKTKFVTNDNLTRKRWARDLFRILLPAIEFNALTGTDANNPIQIRTELGKGEGDQITFGIRLPLTGEGVVGDEAIEGNEEKMQFRDFKMTIEELNHAVDTGGKMEEQRVPYNLMQEGRDALQEWWAAKLSTFLINACVGNSAYQIKSGVTFADALEEPDVYHFLAVNQAALTAVATCESAITSADVMDLTFLDRMKQLAEIPNTGCYKIRPLNKGGKNYFHVVMHNYVFEQLRQNTNIAQWGDMLRSAGKLALPHVELEYNGMLIQKSERVPRMRAVGTALGSGVYRTVLMGAQALCWAWGGAGDSKSTVMAFVPYKKDAERFTMIRGGGIFGVKKTRFNSMDYGIITAASFGAPIQ